MDLRKIEIKINAATGRQIDDIGNVISRSSEYLKVFYADAFVVCATFYDVTESSEGANVLTVHPVPEDAVFNSYGDNDFTNATALMFLSQQIAPEAEDPENGIDNRVDITGDWLDGGTANPALGQKSFLINTNTTRFSEALNGKDKKEFNFVIDMVPSGETEVSLAAFFPAMAYNRPVLEENAQPEETDPAYLTAAQIMALWASPGVYQFSVDASSWHTEQTKADRYFRWSWDGVNYGDGVLIPGITEPFEKTFDSTTDDAELSWDAGTTTEATIIHGLNLQAPSVVVKNNTSSLLETPVVKYIDANTVKLTFGETPTDELYVCIGYGSGNVAAPAIVELSGAAVTVDGSLSDRFKFDPAGVASTVSFDNFTEGGEARLSIIDGDTYVSFPAGIVWKTSADETQPPALQAAGTDVIEFLWASDTEIWGYLI